jgi:CRP-like cAMP-binding protein
MAGPPVWVRRNQVLWGQGQRCPSAFFPLTCAISLVATSADGRGVEVATIFKDGLAGVSAVLHPEALSAVRAVCLVQGWALRVPVFVFSRHVVSNLPLRTILDRYLQARLANASNALMCGRLHSVKQSCAKWILSMSDGLGLEGFSITHAVLAELLGVRRASVTEALGYMEEAGAIGGTRGTVTITDRRCLEGLSCECYQLMQAEMERLAHSLRMTRGTLPLSRPRVAVGGSGPRAVQPVGAALG